MKIKTTYSTKKDFQKLRENGFKLNVGDKIRLSFCLPGKEGLYPPVECHKEGATLIQKTKKEMLFVMEMKIIRAGGGFQHRQSLNLRFSATAPPPGVPTTLRLTIATSGFVSLS